MRRLIISMLCMFVCLAHAADGVLPTDILESLARHPSVRAEFVQTRNSPALTQSVVSRGKLLFVLGHGMLWQIESPYRETLALAGDHATRIDVQGHAQTLHDEQGVGRISQMLQSLLTGKSEALLRQFEVTTTGGPTHWSLRLTPRQSRMAQVLDAIVLEGADYLDGIRLEMHDGTITDIRLHDVREAGPLDAGEARILSPGSA
jgi:outer membrane lipoprotein-sorting protein